MEFGFTREHEEFRARIKTFFKQAITPALLEEVERDGNEWSEKLYMGMINAGLGKIGIPKEYGGEGRGHTEMAIFHEESAKAGLPHGVGSLFDNTALFAAIATIRFGTEEQKKRWLPGIFDGSLRSTQGYTEPGCGSDLANVQCKAEADGDDYILNGQKMFNSGHIATHMLAVTRTNRDVPKHKGISLFLTRIKGVPGVGITPLITMRGWKRNIVTFENVRISKTDMLGEKDQGWYLLMRMMDMERSGINLWAEWATVFDEIVAWVKTQRRDGKPLTQFPTARGALADLRREMIIGWLLCHQIVDLQEKKQDATLRASFARLYNSELAEREANLAIDMAGSQGLVEAAGKLGKKYSPAKGLMSKLYKDSRINQIAGGTSEIQRNIIAQRGLGLPR